MAEWERFVVHRLHRLNLCNLWMVLHLTAAGVVRWIDLPGLGIGGIRIRFQIAATTGVIWWVYRFERFV